MRSQAFDPVFRPRDFRARAMRAGPMRVATPTPSGYIEAPAERRVRSAIAFEAKPAQAAAA